MSEARARLTCLWPEGAALGCAALLVMASPGVLPVRAASWLAWLAFALAFLAIERVSPRRALLVGWVAGFALNAGACMWFPGLIARFTGCSPALAILASIAVWSWQALLWSAWAGATAWLKPSRWLVPSSAALFVVLERFAPLVFPYSVGLTQVDHLWIAQTAELGGPSVIAFLIVAFGGAIAACVRAVRAKAHLPWILLGAVSALFMCANLFGAVRLSTVRAWRADAPRAVVGVVQAGIVQTGWRAEPEPADLLQRYQQASASIERDLVPVQLLVWPEKAYPHLLRRDSAHDYPPGHPKRIRGQFSAPLVFGHNAVDATSRELTNAVSLLDGDRLSLFYEKAVLIPYSEWLPQALASRSRGVRYQPGSSVAPVRTSSGNVGTFICFESAFPSHIRGIMQHGPDWLLNVSDDTWFGASAEPEQHLATVVLRAIESRRDLLRATGSGISAHVAATGQIVQRTPVSRSEPEVLVASVSKLGARSLYARLGDSFVWMCAMAAAAALSARLILHRRAAPPPV